MAGIVDAPRGFIPIKSQVGGESGRVHPYSVAAANAILGKFDFVTATNAGVVDRSAASDVYIVGSIAMAVAAASGEDHTPVYDNPFEIFLCQSDDGTVDEQTDMNLNYDIIVADAVNGVSQMELDGDTFATNAALPLKLLRVHRQPGNTLGANVAVEVIVNNHMLNGEQAGI